MGYSENVTPDNAERLHIPNVNEACRSSNTVNYIPQILKHSEQCTCLDYMDETLSYHAREGPNDIDSVKVFDQFSATNTRRITLCAHLLHLQ